MSSGQEGIYVASPQAQEWSVGSRRGTDRGDRPVEDLSTEIVERHRRRVHARVVDVGVVQRHVAAAQGGAYVLVDVVKSLLRRRWRGACHAVPSRQATKDDMLDEGKHVVLPDRVYLGRVVPERVTNHLGVHVPVPEMPLDRLQRRGIYLAISTEIPAQGPRLLRGEAPVSEHP